MMQNHGEPEYVFLCDPNSLQCCGCPALRTWACFLLWDGASNCSAGAVVTSICCENRNNRGCIGSRDIYPLVISRESSLLIQRPCLCESNEAAANPGTANFLLLFCGHNNQGYRSYADRPASFYETHQRRHINRKSRAARPS